MTEKRTGGVRLEEAEAAVEEAEVAVRRAEEALRRAKYERWFVYMDEAAARARRLVDETKDMPASDFAEKVADAARDHGSECASAGRTDTTRSWKRFRILLAELARRAESGEESRRTLATANVRSDMEIAILVREVICEAIYRRRADWDPEHPVRALGLRDIPLDLVLSEFWDTNPGRLDQLAKMDLRGYASVVLDRVLLEARQLKAQPTEEALEDFRRCADAQGRDASLYPRCELSQSEHNRGPYCTHPEGHSGPCSWWGGEHEQDQGEWTRGAARCVVGGAPQQLPGRGHGRDARHRPGSDP